MAAHATCKTPFVDKWKDAADKNEVLGFIDSVLSGYGQIAFNDNPISGLLFIIGCFVGSVQMGVSSLVCAVISTLLAYLIGVPRLSCRLGLYTFNAALAGMGLALFVFPGEGITGQMLLYSAIAAVFSVFLTAAFAAFFIKMKVPALALPYCMVLFIMVPASIIMTSLHDTTSVLPHLGEVAVIADGGWTVGQFFRAVMNGLAEVIWQANVFSGALFALGVLIASRIDFLSITVAAIVSTALAIAFGLPSDNILLGLYGYNAVLLMMVFFGRGYQMTVKSYIFSLLMSCMTIVFTVALSVIFAPLRAPVAAFPYVIMAIFALVAKEPFTGLKWVSHTKWGVPETIAVEIKKEK
ncbi:MAG: urea transporter [Anaerovoracaceae bacterium]